MPLPIHSFNAPKKTPYIHVKATAYAAFKSSDEKLNEKGDQSDKDFVDSMEIGSSGSRDASPARNQKFSLCGYLLGIDWHSMKVLKVSGMFRRNNSASDLSAELKMLQKMENDAKLMEDTIQKKQKQCEQIDQTDLEYRIDYQLRESSFENSYISMLTSHTSYWTNKDVAFFILTHLHPEMQESCDD
ncbi:hypothetical protein KUTeg_013965 [Tegillarca granosa]|uniref:DDHD domain-containing protein n=1 Tax=Tegillarca granosa TaxID=220873 RepID=A0ABQ9EXP9_TEGGR|nr:hypothetical protein KUTeg_013965 [Tegillarca granosa]